MNALVSDAENALTNIKNNLYTLKVTVVESEEKLNSHINAIQSIEKSMEENQSLIQIENEKLSEHQANASEDKARLVEIEAEYRASIEKLDIQQTESQKINELINLETTRIDYINKSIEDLQIRRAQLNEESKNIQQKITNKENIPSIDMEDINKQISIADRELLEKKNLLSELEQETKKFNIQKEEHLKELQQTEIQITTLSNFVDSEIEDEVTNQFLKKIDIDKDRNIFKNVNIEKGWEKAIGFILADYASAYENKKIAPNSLKEIPTNK